MTPATALEDQNQKTTYLCMGCGNVEHEFPANADWYEAYFEDAYRRYIPAGKRHGEKNRLRYKPERRPWRDFLEV